MIFWGCQEKIDNSFGHFSKKSRDVPPSPFKNAGITHNLLESLGNTLFLGGRWTGIVSSPFTNWRRHPFHVTGLLTP